jgi:beta-galactosidase GanA
LVVLLPQTSFSKDKIPHLNKVGNTTQLIVDSKPYLILGGELGNSTATSMQSMQSVWPELKALNLNTVLIPIYWELIEQEEGVFDFKLVEQLIYEARKQDLKLVFLWFGAWKNSMSSHVPSWVKQDQQRFPRVKDNNGMSHEILTPFSQNNLQADLNAYTALVRHIKKVDGKKHTVIMLQTENEIGMLPTARDHSALANKQFQQDVPSDLLNYLTLHKQNLVPEFYLVWQQNGFKTSGTWQDVFGIGTHTDEIFMAWYYAQFTHALIQSGKAVYPLPMFVNAALNRPNTEPGSGYPSAGPLPHLMDVWKAGAPSIDFLAPDFYVPDIKHWSDLYTRQQNPLFIPEHRFDNTAAAKAAFVIGHYEAIGFSPFSIESKEQPENEDLGKMYFLLNQLTPVITAHQGQGKIDAVLIDKNNQQTVLTMGDYEFTVKHSHTLGWEASAKDDVWKTAAAIIVQTAENEFYIAGTGVVITFKNLTNPELNVGILKVDEGRFDDEKWTVVRHLNGDQTHQGRHVRIFMDNYQIQKLALYNYE